MKNTTFVSAGAGSGKTYRLTQEVVNAIKNYKYRGDELIMTTYTTLAANELREEVRSALYKEHLYEAAVNIDNSAIGTIHSIANQFVSRYWYLLGISPNMNIMPQEEQKRFATQSMATLLEEDDLVFFERMQKTFNLYTWKDNKSAPDKDFWKKDLDEIISKMVEMRIDKKQLEQAKEFSLNLLSKSFAWKKDYIFPKNIVDEVIKNAATIAEKTNDAKKKEKVEELIDSLKKYNKEYSSEYPIYEMFKLAEVCTKNPPKYLQRDCSKELDFFKDLLEKIPVSTQVQDIAETYVKRIFGLALKWHETYNKFKAERCVLDYNDLLAKFNELLDNEMVVEELRSRYKMALIDEFQDCSPLQVDVFNRLSEVMERNIWVGDIKQAIYGFRGTNPELIKKVIEEVKLKENGNYTSDPLPHCWRSSNVVINIVNNIFTKVFADSLDESLVKLSYPPKDIDKRDSRPNEKKPLYWHLDASKKEVRLEILAQKIKKLVESGDYKYSEIAILHKDNSKDCVAALRKHGIPVNVKQGLFTENDNPISDFITAVISVIAYPNDDLSKAIIANKIEDEYAVSRILSDRLSQQSAVNSQQSKFIERLLEVGKTVGNQSVKSAVETVLVEMNLLDVMKRIDPEAQGYNYYSALLNKAEEYETHCKTIGFASTLTGFAMYIKESPITLMGNEEGVTVTTYHSSKGLEWPCVILCSLDNSPVKDERLLWGVMTKSAADYTQLCLMPRLGELCSDNRKADMKALDFYDELYKLHLEEHKRLMYVGMTRAKEQLILTHSGKNQPEWFKSIGYPMEFTSDFVWAGQKWGYELCNVAEETKDEGEDKSGDVVTFKALKEPENREKCIVKKVSPSMVKKAEKVKGVEEVASFGDRLAIVANDKKDSTIGNFIHHLMYLWNDDENISAVAENLAKEYGVSVNVKLLLDAIRKFWKCLEEKYGKATSIERELPFTLRMDDGRVANGEIDLIYRTANGDVLIDYKTYQGAKSHLVEEGNKFNAGDKYGGQIELYRKALVSAGHNVIDNLICYMSLGVIVRVEF